MVFTKSNVTKGKRMPQNMSTFDWEKVKSHCFLITNVQRKLQKKYIYIEGNI